MSGDKSRIAALVHFFSALILSTGACPTTVNTVAGVGRHGRVSAVPVMGQDTLEPPATPVSERVCLWCGREG